MEHATFSAGCFWGVQEIFDDVSGIEKTMVGYAGGHSKNPTYKQVATGKTGHAETIDIEYDPGIISYEQLLDVFWNMHDPTSLNRQGFDYGTQYRSVIFYRDKIQKKKALESKEKQEKRIGKKIVTEIKPYERFWPAEEHHQKYIQKQKNRLLI